MEFQVDGPMKPNLKTDLVFSAAGFPIGTARRRRSLEPYSIRINESGSRTLSDGNRNAMECTRPKKQGTISRIMRSLRGCK
jgi:hypothetical protein